MDGNKPIIKGGTERSNNHEIVVGGGEGLTSFFIPGDIDAAFRENEWSVAEMIEVLTNIVRDGTTRRIERRDGSVIEEAIVTAREKMAAITMLDRKAKEGMILGGLIQKERLTAKGTTPDGVEVEYNAEGRRLTKEGSSRLQSTLALLMEASGSKSDEVIDIDPETGEVLEKQDDTEPRGNQPRNVRCDGPPRGGKRSGSLLPRRPGGSDSDDGSGGPGSECGPDRPSGGGDGVCEPVHEVERPSDGEPQYRGSGEGPRREQDDQEPVEGAEDERGGRVLVEPGRGESSEELGSEDGVDGEGDWPNPEAPRRPVVPGESSVKRANWWEPGIPRRSDDSDAGSIRDCETAESSTDRLRRIDAARKQASAAAAGYLARRAKNQRTREHSPGDANEPGTSDSGD